MRVNTKRTSGGVICRRSTMLNRHNNHIDQQNLTVLLDWVLKLLRHTYMFDVELMSVQG